MSRANKIIIFSLILAFFGAAFFHGASPVRGTNASIFTISVWVKPSGSTVSKAILGKAEELRVATNGSSQPVCQIKSSSSWQTAATSSAAISVGAWSHVACTYDLAYVRIYVNGIETGSQALAVAADDTSAVAKIGRDDSGSTPYGYFAGQVDEFKFYTSALTPEQIAMDMNQGKELQLGGQSSATGATGQAAEYCVPGDATSCAGPVGEWKFDEKTGGSVNDTSGNGNLGTWYGTGTHWDRGKYGSAGKFDGSSDYVKVGSAGIDLSSGSTYSAWFKPNDLTTSSQSIIKNSLGVSNKFALELGSATVAASYTNGGGIHQKSGTISNMNWHHVEFTWDGSTQILYIDGVAQTGNTIPNSSNASNFVIGASSNLSTPALFFNGLIDQVQIFNYARTPAQIAWDYNRGKPVGWWKMDEGEGDKAYDSSGNANTGTLTTMDPPNDWVAGKFGKALDFDGSNDHVVIADSSTIHTVANANLTLAAWVKPSNLCMAGICDVIFKGNFFSPSPYGLDMRSGIWYALNNLGGTSLGLSATQGVWQHIAVVFRSDGTAIGYLNGAASAPISKATTADGADNLFIGCAQDGDGLIVRDFPGQIDDVRVYNYALTAEQVKQVMNNGSVVKFGE